MVQSRFQEQIPFLAPNRQRQGTEVEDISIQLLTENILLAEASLQQALK